MAVPVHAEDSHQLDFTHRPFRIVVFTPTTVGNTYWPEVHRVMSAAAASRNAEIDFHEFGVGDRFLKPEEGARILRSDPPPDGAIFSVVFGQAEPLMAAAESRDIPFFLHGPLFPDELEHLGGAPRGAYRNWIGYFHEDEEAKGYLLARELITAARANRSDGGDEQITIAGIGGDSSWYGSALREAGLRRAVTEDPVARLVQTVPTRWTPEEGYEMAVRLLERYPRLDVIWAASDQLALGVSQALTTRSEDAPDRTTVTGGLDLSMVGLEGVQEGLLTATVASEPDIWATIVEYLHDYLHGVDFADRLGTEILFPPEVAVPSTAGEFIRARRSPMRERDR